MPGKSQEQLQEINDLEKNWFSIRRLDSATASSILQAIKDVAKLEEGTKVRKISYNSASGHLLERIYLYPGVTEEEADKVQKAINPIAAEPKPTWIGMGRDFSSHGGHQGSSR